MSEVVTIRIDKHTKEKIKKHGINVSLTVRKALEEEIRKKEEEDFASLERARKNSAKDLKMKSLGQLENPERADDTL